MIIAIMPVEGNEMYNNKAGKAAIAVAANVIWNHPSISSNILIGFIALLNIQVTIHYKIFITAYCEFCSCRHCILNIQSTNTAANWINYYFITSY